MKIILYLVENLRQDFGLFVIVLYCRRWRGGVLSIIRGAGKLCCLSGNQHRLVKDLNPKPSQVASHTHTHTQTQALKIPTPESKAS